jgi:peptide/nickel transport system permease protein
MSRFRSFIHHKLGAVGATIASIVVLAAVSAPILAPEDPVHINMSQSLRPPSGRHIFGTDQFGRDIFSRVLYGARTSVGVSLTSIGAAALLGVPLGLASGFMRGPVDAIAMRLMDALQAFPALLLALGLVASLGPSARSGIIAIALVYIPVFARVSRGGALRILHEQYIEAAAALGQTKINILLRYVLPNSLAPIIVQATLACANALIIEASLSFLGAGTPPPTPDWGSMLNEARQFMLLAPHTAIFPGMAISLAVLAFNLLGDGLRDVLDPRLR